MPSWKPLGRGDVEAQLSSQHAFRVAHLSFPPFSTTPGIRHRHRSQSLALDSFGAFSYDGVRAHISLLPVPSGTESPVCQVSEGGWG